MFVRRVGAVAIAVAIIAIHAGSAEAALCVRGVESWDTLRVRSGPGPQAREVGHIPPGACGVTIVGGCRGWWCPVTWRGRTGWSHSSYLANPGPLAALGIPAWGATTPVRREARKPVPPKPQRVAREQAPVQTASIPRPPQEVTRTIAEPKTPPAPTPAVAPPAKPAPVAPAPVLVPTPQAAPVAPPPVNSALAPSAAAATAPPPSAAAPPTTEKASVGQPEVCVVDIPKEDTLKVRAGPGIDQALRFGFPSGACGVKLTGTCNDGWCPVDYRGYRGWAEQKFLK